MRLEPLSGAPLPADGMAETPRPEGPVKREVKVKLPVDQVLRLHYERIRDGRNFSQIVSSALTRYFDDLRKA